MIGKRILVAPLDWGLGHATRCIPIIRALVHQGHQVLIAADGPIEILLRSEFPQLSFLPLQGYKIGYGKSKSKLALSLLVQIPKILRSIRFENAWLKSVVNEHQIDMVISDNRYGLYNGQIPCIFITHQLLIQAPVFKGLLQRINYRFINRFNAVWIPDYADEKENLAGVLSHPGKKPAIPFHYLGPLSRFRLQPAKRANDFLLILLSGPEPQRSILEQLFVHQLQNYQQPVVLVRGLPGSTHQLKLSKNVQVFNHLAAKDLEKLMQEASYIISRSGYSTVMDIMALQKKSILIPTPGQTEQEYLAKHLTKQHYALCVPQSQFDLKKALVDAGSFRYQYPLQPMDGLEPPELSFIKR